MVKEKELRKSIRQPRIFFKRTHTVIAEAKPVKQVPTNNDLKVKALSPSSLRSTTNLETSLPRNRKNVRKIERDFRYEYPFSRRKKELLLIVLKPFEISQLTVPNDSRPLFFIDEFFFLFALFLIAISFQTTLFISTTCFGRSFTSRVLL